MHCGCPLPGETIGQRLSRLVSQQLGNPSHLIPPDRNNLLAATHPSDHNAVFAFHRRFASWLSQQKRRQKFQKRQLRDEKLASHGKINQRGINRSYDHSPAFLVAVPFFIGTASGCVAASGSIVHCPPDSGVGGCASVHCVALFFLLEFFTHA